MKNNMIKFQVKVGSVLDTWLITEAESKAINSMKIPIFIGLDKNNKFLGYYLAHTRRMKGCDYEGAIKFNGTKSNSWGIGVEKNYIKWYNSGGNIEPKATTCIVKDLCSFFEEPSEVEVNLF